MDKKTNLLIPGGLFIGMGLGLIFNNVAAGVFLGLGTGFIFSTLAVLFNKKRERSQS
ncbi:hypothetical protein [Bacillus thermotolerans]|uniref:Uncharacterized protein n=1 Tax=Bacillus thermotolerans TaxID=1221996 RepID=A0A0F5HNL7_BACTR|nr:hypothetical protein [Bacillus thermotolerans]KKB34169.1 hypothetical protein QY96_00262 [Bacillus thermotolerans]KKB34432.1 hypothetical protein QY97_02505 [Bacillus thermotolerans]KKB38176.1 hypothetical protein QY95_02631 [Bacillus thermotolerans]